MHPRLATRRVAGVLEVPVVVPLQIGDRIFIEDRVESLLDVGEGIVVAEVEHLLVAGQDRCPPARGHDPVGMGPSQVGVGVDHLRLDPQAELHAEGADVVDERMQTLGVDVRVDVPVAEPCAVVPAPPEPPVVEHVALGSDLRRGVGQGEQPVAVVHHVHGLPGVQRHRPRLALRRVLRAGAQPLVEAVREPVEAIGVRGEQPRPLVALSWREHDLAGEEQLPAADDRIAGAQALGVRAVVAAPADVQPPHLTLAEAEALRAGHDQQSCVRPGPAAPVVPKSGTDREGLPLGRAFPDVASGEVQQFVRLGRHRQGEQQPVDGVGQAIIVIAHRPAHPDQPRRGELDLDGQAQSRGAVDRVDDDTLRAGPGPVHCGVHRHVYRAHHEHRRPVGSVAMAGEARSSEPTAGVLRDQREFAHLVEVVRGDRRDGDQRHRLQRRVVDVPYVPTPMHDAGQRATAQVEDEADTRRPQVDKTAVVALPGFVVLARHRRVHAPDRSGTPSTTCTRSHRSMAAWTSAQQRVPVIGP